MSFNASQTRAIHHKNGPMLVLAEAKSNIPSDTMLVSSYEEALEKYRRESQSWTMPAEN